MAMGIFSGPGFGAFLPTGHKVFFFFFSGERWTGAGEWKGEWDLQWSPGVNLEFSALHGGWETTFRLVINLQPWLLGHSSSRRRPRAGKSRSRLWEEANNEPTLGVGEVSTYVATQETMIPSHHLTLLTFNLCQPTSHLVCSTSSELGRGEEGKPPPHLRKGLPSKPQQ